MSFEGRQSGGDQLGTWERLGSSRVVAILDAGAQYGMDIEQQVKRLGFNAKRLPFETTYEELQGCAAVILSGGPEDVFDPTSPRCDRRLLEGRDDGPPVLGDCYGAQVMNYMLGGTVEALDTREDGFTDIIVDPGSLIFNGLEPSQEVLMSHGNTIVEPAKGFEVIARSGDLVAAIANPKLRLYGVQFHPEVSTAEGPAMLRNFLQLVAGMEPNYEYSTEEYLKDAVEDVRNQVGDRQVLAFVSGGVDSSALAALLKRALPSEQVFLVYVNNGFMREGETANVKASLADAGVDIRIFDGSDMFLSATTVIDGTETPPLYQVTDPEVKRKIIGNTFIRVQDEMAGQLGLDAETFMLAMGTLHTDLIESGSKHASQKADTIKSHHNDTEEVRKLRDLGRVIEPWRNIQKDDVRVVAHALGLPDAIVNRQPFPGPGLAIRIICAESPYITEESLAIAEQLEQFSSANIGVALLPIRTVGVQGDHRTYGHLVALTGEGSSWQERIELARFIPRQVHGVNRVVHLFGSRVDGMIDEITPTHLTSNVIDQLRLVDSIVNDKLTRHGLDRSTSQVPVVSFPVPFGNNGSRSIGVRTIKTSNFKTGDIAVPGTDFPEPVLNEIVEDVLRIPGIARVAYDLTSKPPGTTEWE